MNCEMLHAFTLPQTIFFARCFHVKTVCMAMGCCQPPEEYLSLRLQINVKNQRTRYFVPALSDSAWQYSEADTVLSFKLVLIYFFYKALFLLLCSKQNHKLRFVMPLKNGGSDWKAHIKQVIAEEMAHFNSKPGSSIAKWNHSIYLKTWLGSCCQGRS